MRKIRKPPPTCRVAPPERLPEVILAALGNSNQKPDGDALEGILSDFLVIGVTEFFRDADLFKLSERTGAARFAANARYREPCAGLGGGMLDG